jgi:hypothetical protein
LGVRCDGGAYDELVAAIPLSFFYLVGRRRESLVVDILDEIYQCEKDENDLPAENLHLYERQCDVVRLKCVQISLMSGKLFVRQFRRKAIDRFGGYIGWRDLDAVLGRNRQ